MAAAEPVREGAKVLDLPDGRRVAVRMIYVGFRPQAAARYFGTFHVRVRRGRTVHLRSPGHQDKCPRAVSLYYREVLRGGPRCGGEELCRLRDLPQAENLLLADSYICDKRLSQGEAVHGSI